MTPRQYLALLGILEAKGFKVTRDSCLLRSYAEFYKWNQWTVQLTAQGLDKVESFTVEVYFDSEALAYRNTSKTYLPEQSASVLCYIDECLRCLREGQISLLCDALQD